MGGAYSTIAADVLARYQRLRGKRVTFVTGTDEHGEKIALAAEKAGIAPQEHCDRIAALYQQLWLQVSSCHVMSAMFVWLERNLPSMKITYNWVLSHLFAVIIDGQIRQFLWVLPPTSAGYMLSKYSRLFTSQKPETVPLSTSTMLTATHIFPCSLHMSKVLLFKK